jgi:hypothetical protein
VGVGWCLFLGRLGGGVGRPSRAPPHVRGEVRNIVMCASGRRVPELEYDTLVALGEALGS